MRLALCFFAIAGIAAAQTLVPAPGSPFRTGSGPVAVVAADFNGDAKADLAIANYDSNTVTVLLGNGVGGFTPAAGSPFPAGTSPISLTSADFNSDGRLDLAVADADGSVTVLLGNGAGGFTMAAGSPIATALFQVSIASADFNGDGKPDLAIVNELTDNIGILLGNGLGGFSPAPGSPFPAGTDPRFVLVADLNRDGKPDLAIANGDSGQVTVLLGNGSGGFVNAPGSPFLAGRTPEALALGDFNKDGKPDLAAVNRASNNVTVLLGDGAGGFTGAPGTPTSAGALPVSAVAGDFNADGNPDIAVVSETGNVVNILLGNGTGGFSMGNSFATGSSPFAAVVADFNGDGRPDLAVVNNFSDDVTVLLGTAGGGAQWSISKTHVGSFLPGQNGATYALSFTNIGNAATSGTVSVVDTIPAGLTLVSMAGSGWTCAGNTCSRIDALGAGASYPPITVTVGVSSSAPAQLTNKASIGGGGAALVTAFDPTNILPASGVYLSSVPAGAALVLDGTARTTPVTIGLASGIHTLTAPLSLPAIPGYQFLFTGWSDGVNSPSRSITTGSQPAAYSALYGTQIQLTIAASPSAAGTVSPGSGFYASGVIPISVTPSPTFQFSSWTGGVADPTLASTKVTVDSPKIVTANLIPTSSFFVTQLYRDLLSRNPDTGGFNYWTGLINNGTLPREIVASSLFTSPEFTQSGLYVIKLYVGVLGRDPDFGGWLNWFTALRSGATPAAVLTAFLASPEFQNTYGSVTNSDFVTLVYRNVLKRAPDPGGFANWLGYLNGGQLTRADVMGAFVNGPEFDNLVRSRAYANLLYMGFLRRTADTGGLTYWTGILTAGNPLSSVIYGFINGPEYLNRLASLP